MNPSQNTIVDHTKAVNLKLVSRLPARDISLHPGWQKAFTEMLKFYAAYSALDEE